MRKGFLKSKPSYIYLEQRHGDIIASIHSPVKTGLYRILTHPTTISPRPLTN